MENRRATSKRDTGQTWPVELHGRHVTLRPLSPKDAPRLAEILRTPEVGRWWTGYDLARVEAEFLADEPRVTVYGIGLGEQLVGLIQVTEEPEPDFRHASIDLFVDPAVQGRGLGPDAIRTVARHLIDHDGHHRLTIDPAADNEQAIRAYAKVGFRPVGIMRRYQRFPDGIWRDALLMDLLADELEDER
jgi:aminoglycoside 6'-N-acetyltransferase